jgi:hypothetical protein
MIFPSDAEIMEGKKKEYEAEQKKRKKSSNNQYFEQEIFINSLTKDNPDPDTPDRTPKRKRGSTSQSLATPRPPKRQYKWKSGAAPERRCGHAKYPEGHKFYNMPKKGEFVPTTEAKKKDNTSMDNMAVDRKGTENYMDDDEFPKHLDGFGEDTDGFSADDEGAVDED